MASSCAVINLVVQAIAFVIRTSHCPAFIVDDALGGQIAGEFTLDGANIEVAGWRGLVAGLGSVVQWQHSSTHKAGQ